MSEHFPSLEELKEQMIKNGVVFLNRDDYKDFPYFVDEFEKYRKGEITEETLLEGKYNFPRNEDSDYFRSLPPLSDNHLRVLRKAMKKDLLKCRNVMVKHKNKRIMIESGTGKIHDSPFLY